MNKYMKTLASIIALALVASACEDHLTEVNENPNAPSTVTAGTLFNHGIQTAVDEIMGYELHLDWTAIFVQHYAEVQYIEEDIYQLRTSSINDNWRDLYVDPLADFDRIIEKGRESGSPNVVALGLIMKSWTFAALTDLWGSVPYTDALAGDSVLQPEFTDQQAVYLGLLADLKAASEMIVPAAPGLGKFDLIYNGNMELWRRFANSLRLRYAMRLSETPVGEQAKQHFIDAWNDGPFQSNADNAVLQWLSTAPNRNPVWLAKDNSVGGRDDRRVSSSLTDTLKILDDPRLFIYAMPAPAPLPYLVNNGADTVTYETLRNLGVRYPELYPSYQGQPNGLQLNPIPIPVVSEIGAFYFRPDAPDQLMGYAEVLFLAAEGAQRGWISGDPASLYKRAISASLRRFDGAIYINPETGELDRFDMTEEIIEAYISQPRVQWDAGPWEAQLGLQKWIALYDNGPEAFAEFRRLGYPELEPGPDALFDRVLTRIPYPTTAVDLNENLTPEEQTTRLDRVWWDQATGENDDA